MSEQGEAANKFLRVQRVNTAIGVVLATLGIALMAYSKSEPNSLWHDIVGQVGSSLLTVGLIELLLFSLLEKMKYLIVQDLVDLDERLSRQSSVLQSAASDARAIVEQAEERIRAIETNLFQELAMSKLESIHLAVDPVYRELTEFSQSDEASNS